MLNQNYALDFLTKTNQPASDIKRSPLFGVGQTPEFKNILGAALEKSQNNYTKSVNQSEKRPKNPNENESYQSEKPRQNDQVRNFQEAQRNRVKENSEGTKAVEKMNDKVEEPSPKDTQKKVAGNKQEVMEKCLSQVLGVHPGELEELLKYLNVNPEDLIQDTKTDEIAAKLGELLGLGLEQQKALEKIMSAVHVKVNQYLGELKAHDHELPDKNTQPVRESNKMDQAGWTRVEGVKIDVITLNGKPKGFDEICSAMKQSIEQLTQKLADSSQKGLEDIIKVTEDLLKQESVKDSEAAALPNGAINQKDGQKEGLMTKNNPKADDSKYSEEKTGKVEQAKSGEENESESESGLGTGLKTPVKQDEQLKGARNDNGKPTQFSDVLSNQTQNNKQVSEIQKPHRETIVPKNEIISQFVDKAKVLLNGDKSEMVMDLKPDHLGKLSLKVVTESGIVMAKFVAESEQVKAALEANMQLLKESLEKQGLSVQGFSVSVGQDSSKEMQGQNHQAGFDKKGSRDAVKPVSAGMVQVADIKGELQRTNPYGYTDSRINLTA